MEIAITLTIVFVVLKFVGVLDWSWWWIFSPLWIGAIITGIMYGVFGLASMFFSRRERRQRPYIGGAWNNVQEIEQQRVKPQLEEARPKTTEAERTGKVTAGGVLMIISGVMGLILGTGVILETTPTEYSSFIGAYIGLSILFLVLAVLPVISGVFALRRQTWGLALAGAIIAIFWTPYLGVPAVILIALGKREFA